MAYMVYFDGEFARFDSWPEAKAFIDEHEGCYFKKVESKRAEDMFKKKYAGKPNYQKKFYVAINNGKIERFSSWPECKEYVDQYPNCVFKSFVDIAEAQKFINANIRNISLDLDDTMYLKSRFHLDRTNHILDYGFYLEKNGSKIGSYNGRKEHAYPRDILIQEIRLTKKGILQAIELEEERIIVVNHNEGLSMWTNGSWEAKTEMAKDFVNFINDKKKLINIDFLLETN